MICPRRGRLTLTTRAAVESTTTSQDQLRLLAAPLAGSVRSAKVVGFALALRMSPSPADKAAEDV